MGYASRGIAAVGGRRVVAVVGGLYVLAAVGWPLAPAADPPALGDVLLLSSLAGGSGLAMLAAGYWLPRTEVRPELYASVAAWCLSGIGIMTGILLLAAVLGTLDSPMEGVLGLTPLAGVAGLGVGYHDARAETRARNAEERRAEAERYGRELERYGAIVETVGDGIYVVDEDGRFTLVNEAYAEMVGYDREELLGSHTSLVVDDDAERLADEIERDLQAGADGTKTYEATLRTASGERIEAEATMAFLPEGADGARDRVGVVRDVTERNEREQRLERQNERLDSFASMLAHELRNPVTIGQIYGQQLPDEHAPEAVEYVTEAFDRIEDMIDVMLVLTRGREAVGESEPVVLADVARAAWENVETGDATLAVDLDGVVAADETYVRHLFRNLFENAVEHGSTSPRSQAHEDAVQHGGPDVTVEVGDLPGDESGFYVADDGEGIPAEERELVFEAGYTTASGQGGTGLGLAFVDELADVYGWECAVTESDSGGARFEFTGVAATERVAE